MTVFIKPIKGVIVRDPRTKQIIPKEGVSVELTSYWQRRITDKTVTLSVRSEKKKQTFQPAEPVAENKSEGRNNK